MTRNSKTVGLALALLGAISGQAISEQLPDNFTLGRYVPDSCWVYTHGVYSPERAGIDAQWARVLAAVDTDTLINGFKGLMGQLCSGVAQEEFERQWAATTGLISQVSWNDLIAREFAFAAQMSPLPSHLLLCQGAPGTGPKNLAALAAILEHGASLSDTLCVDKATIGDIQVWTMDLPGAPFSLEIFGRGDVVGLCTCRPVTKKVLGLMLGKPGAGSVVDSPRFQRALASLAPPEDMVSFIDCRAMFADMRALFEGVMGNVPPGSKSPPEKEILLNVFKRFDVFDYVLTVRQTDGAQERSDTIAVVRPECKDAPFARVFTNRQPLEDPLRFVPADATSFSASVAIDWGALYALALDIIGNDIPNGQEILAKWQGVQESLGFDVQADLFDWLSGETIAVSFPSDGVSPFGAGDSVLLIRVKDAALARQKVDAAIARLDVDVSQRYTNIPLNKIPAPDIRAEGFHRLMHPILMSYQIQPVVGLHDKWLVLGSSAAAINKVLDTEDGKLPRITTSERFMREGALPTGNISSVSFSDLSNMGQDLSNLFYGIGMASALVPNEPDMHVLKMILTLPQALAPAISEIDFYSSSAMAATFDGLTWRIESIINYQDSVLPPK